MSEANQPSDFEVLNGPICRHLLTKAMFVNDEVSVADLNESNSNCWCAHTQNVVGPDDQLVEAPTCTSGRECFEARL
ncbi:MAG: hypothetical protein MPJ50_16295 [Pirellulales bacterium]|nr:hypothetical protein [Pirellulales bacterium]